MHAALRLAQETTSDAPADTTEVIVWTVVVALFVLAVYLYGRSKKPPQ